jgi:glycosyltransferase involved in cell wall biosynthesis
LSRPSQPRLLYVSTLDHIIRVMLPHLDAARAAGFRVEVACQVTRFRDEVLAHADAVHDLPMRRFPLHPKNIVALRRLTRLINDGEFQIVHAHNPTGGFVGRLAATQAAQAKPLRVYTAHGFHFHRHGGRITNAVYRTVERYAGQRLSDAVLTINREDYDAALAGGVVPKDRLYLTHGVGVSAREEFDPSFVTPEDIAAFRAEIGVGAQTPVLSVVGEMLPRKRQFDAIAAMVEIRKAVPEALLVLVGDGAMLEENQRLATSLGVAENCRFLGFRRDVRRILAASQVFLFPSKQEGLPCAIQEAQAMAIPVVATDVRGNADLVDASCGRIVPLGDVKAFAAGVVELLGLPSAAREAMGKAGREKMLTHYDRSACVTEWLNIYRQAWEKIKTGPFPDGAQNP